MVDESWPEALGGEFRTIVQSYLRRDPSQPGSVSSAGGVHSGCPGDVIVVKYGEGKLSVRNEHHLKSVYLHRQKGSHREGSQSQWG